MRVVLAGRIASRPPAPPRFSRTDPHPVGAGRPLALRLAQRPWVERGQASADGLLSRNKGELHPAPPLTTPLGRAMLLSSVAMTTVGYGDKVSQRSAGYMIVAVLVVIGMLCAK